MPLAAWLVFVFFSFFTDPSLSLTGALGHPPSLANASGGSPFFFSVPAVPFAWFIFYFFFLFSADPSPSLTGAQGPHSLANVSGVPFSSVPAVLFATWFVFLLFFLFFSPLTPLPFSHRCIGTPLTCKHEWAFPIFTDLHLPCPFARKRDVRCRSQPVHFFTFTFSFADRPFSHGNPLLLVPLSHVTPVTSSSCHPHLHHVAVSCHPPPGYLLVG